MHNQIIVASDSLNVTYTILAKVTSTLTITSDDKKWDENGLEYFANAFVRQSLFKFAIKSYYPKHRLRKKSCLVQH